MKKLILILIRFLSSFKLTGPLQLVLFITSKCNCDCTHCFYYKELNKIEDLSLKELNKVSETVGRLRTLCLTGGEPFLRKDIVEIVKVFFKNTKFQFLQIPVQGK